MKAYLNAVKAILIFAVLLTLFPTEAQARQQPDEFLIREYSIGLAVECLEEAMQRISDMPGIMLNSSMNMRVGIGNTERRVSNLELAETLEALRGLGRVTTSSSGSRNVLAVVMDTRANLSIHHEQYQRLSELLHEVDTLEHFNLIESRLINVIGDMEFYQGWLNDLEFQTGTSRIFIHLSHAPDLDDDEEEEAGVWARIGQAFTRSAEFTLAVLQWVLLILAYASVPIVFVVIFGLIIIMVISKIAKRRRKDGKKRENNIDDENDEKGSENEETNTDNSNA